MISAELGRAVRSRYGRHLVRMKRQYHLARNYVTTWPIRRDFERFYASLPDKSQCFFMVFPQGLLHWLVRTASCLPRNVNLILIGMGLTPDEQTWLREHIDRPAFHLPVKLDDQAVWQLLFDTMRSDFGWIDMDLFVFNPDVLKQMTVLAPDVSVNSAWAYRSPWGQAVLSTHLLFVNASVIQVLRQAGCRASPVVHTYDGSPLGRFFPGAHSAIPTSREMRLLERVLPLDGAGRPAYPSNFEEKFWFQGFDTMVVYQLLAEASGYRLGRVRELDGIPGSRMHYSNELVHIGALSYYARLRRERSERTQHYYRLLLQLDSLVLDRALERSAMPHPYHALARSLREQLDSAGLAGADRRSNVRRHFEECGLNATVFDHPSWRDLWS